MCHRWLQLSEAFYIIFVSQRGSQQCMRCLSWMHAALDLPALRGHQIHAVRAASPYVHKNEVLSLLLIWDSSRRRFPLWNDESLCSVEKKYEAAVCVPADQACGSLQEFINRLDRFRHLANAGQWGTNSLSVPHQLRGIFSNNDSDRRKWIGRQFFLF